MIKLGSKIKHRRRLSSITFYSLNSTTPIRFTASCRPTTSRQRQAVDLSQAFDICRLVVQLVADLPYNTLHYKSATNQSKWSLD